MEAFQQRGENIESLDKRPVIWNDPFAEELWNCFQALHAGRQTGMGPNPLQTKDIIAMIDFRNISSDLRDVAFGILLSLDQEYLDAQQRRGERGANPPTSD